jgi:hypothetical protein
MPGIDMGPGEPRTRCQSSYRLHRATSAFGRTDFSRFAAKPYDLIDPATADTWSIAERAFAADGMSPEVPTNQKNGST